MNTKMTHLVGQKFGRLTVVDAPDRCKGERAKLICTCDCGNSKEFLAKSVVYGRTKSCGCLQKETIGNARRKHGCSSTRLHTVWRNIKTRCYNPHSPTYKHYGGRGVGMCDEWRSDFAAFAKWAEENGYDPLAERNECTVDRIDVNGDYCPENCRIANQKEQCNNKRGNRTVNVTISELADITGLDYFALYNGIVRRGGNIVDVVGKLRSTHAEVINP